MKNLYEIMESMNKEEKMWNCIRVELNDLRKNPDNFGMNEVDIISQYFGADEEFINNQSDPESIYITDGNVINSKKSIFIRDKDLVDGKLPFKFGRVDENFYCSDCPSLTSLEGAPQEVGGDFYCRNCPSLKSLKGSPQKVGKH